MLMVVFGILAGGSPSPAGWYEGPEGSAVAGGYHHQLSDGCCWGPAGRKQGSKISLETALDTRAVSVCLIKTSESHLQNSRSLTNSPQQRGTSITATALAFPSVIPHCFLAFILSCVPQWVLWCSEKVFN